MVYIFCRIRKHGIKSSLQIFFQKVSSKIKLITLPVRNRLWAFINGIRYRSQKQSDILYAYYDLSTSALDYGVVIYLSIAEKERIRLGLKNLCLVVVPETNDHLQIRANKKIAERDNSTEEEVKEDMEWRLRNIIIPSISLFPSCQIKIFNNRNEAKYFEKIFVKHIFPAEYSMYNPKSINLQHKNTSLVYLVKALSKGELPSIRPSNKAMGYVKDWIRINAKDRKVITLTLRESTRIPARNSSLKDWGKFARNLDPDIYFPVILRDTEKDLNQVPKELKDLTIFHEAVWNFELRAALYELSYLNMAANNGPACLSQMNDKTRYITVKVITNSVGGTSEEYYKSAGLNYGDSLPRSSEYQKFVWEDDTYEVMMHEFKEMCKKIEKFK